MKFLKPKFWDKKQISFLSILLYPIALFIKLINFFKLFLLKNIIVPYPLFASGIFIWEEPEKLLCASNYSLF